MSLKNVTRKSNGITSNFPPLLCKMLLSAGLLKLI